jgi:anti-sigma regulatory factor (Ser/Thr protein kinase)
MMPGWWTMIWDFSSGDAEKMHRARDEFLDALKVRVASDADYPACELIFVELVGNVARHAPGPVRVTLDWTRNAAMLHVEDRGPMFVPRALLPPNLFQTNGRGLFVVRALAGQIDVSPIDSHGKVVSVMLPVRIPAGCEAH